MSFVHNGFAMAVLAHGLIGISLLWDKILLRKPATQDLVSYVFWLGAMSVFGVILAFFGFHWPPIHTALLAFGAGALQLVAVFFYYAALQRGEASESLAIMGGFSPVATALIGMPLLAKPLGGSDLLGFALMAGGGFVMFFTEKMHLRRLLPPVLLACGLYGVVNVAQKIAFNESDFISGYVFFTLGTFAGSMCLLVKKDWRRRIFENSGRAEPRSKEFYLLNRFVNGLGSFLVFYAISLAHPAMVDAMSAVRYAIIFLGAYLITKWKPSWLREDFHGVVLAGKAAATAMVAAGLVIVGLNQSSDKSATPQATMHAPAQRCQRTSSLRISLARIVSTI
ncbi:MAG TPA: DMT family transporter [Bryobacteraceae bacterium]|jgi:drug/metabolite transporter (DMT)-like permease